MTPVALRGDVLTFRGSPFVLPTAEALSYQEDALVVVEDGLVAAVGTYAALAPGLPAGTPVADYRGCLIGAGFVDAHVHYPQLPIIGAQGCTLLEWLDRYAFPAELAFADHAHAKRVAALFVRELLRAGTTTAAVYGTVHAGSIDAFFTESTRWNTRMVAGKVLMDRHAPAGLLEGPAEAARETLALIGRWHGRGRQHYAVTPRFAPSCSDELLAVAGELLQAAPNLYLQTHLAETLAELAWVEELFPARSGYLDVYRAAGLVGRRSVFGHGVHLDEADLGCCHAAGAALAHCPSSNLFLGSGLFRLWAALDPRRPVRVALGSDVGGGTSLSQLATMARAHDVQRLQAAPLTAAQALWLASAGGAEALDLAERIGRVQPGMEADLVALDPAATPLAAFRQRTCRDLDEQLAALVTLAGERTVRATWVAGRPVYDRDRSPTHLPPATPA